MKKYPLRPKKLEFPDSSCECSHSITEHDISMRKAHCVICTCPDFEEKK